MQDFNLSPEKIDELCSKAEEVINRIAKRLEEREKVEEARKEVEEKAKVEVALEETSPPSIEMEGIEELEEVEEIEGTEEIPEEWEGFIREEFVPFLEKYHLPVEEEDNKLTIPCPCCSKPTKILFYRERNEIQLRCDDCSWGVKKEKEVLMKGLPFHWFSKRYSTLTSPDESLEKFLEIRDEKGNLSFYRPLILERIEEYLRTELEVKKDDDPRIPFLQTSALAILGSIYAPSLKFDLPFGTIKEREKKKGRWDLLVLFIAPTGFGKSTILDCVDYLWEYIKKRWKKEKGEEPYLRFCNMQFSSAAGLIRIIARKAQEALEAKQAVSLYWRIDEMAGLFARKPEDYKAQNVPLLISIADGRGFEKALSQEDINCDLSYAYSTFVAGSSYANLTKAINPELELQTGFLGRWLIYYPPEEEDERHQDEAIMDAYLPYEELESEAPEELVDNFYRRMEWTAGRTLFLETTKEARSYLKWWRTFLQVMTRQVPELASWCDRLVYNTLKIGALICAEEMYVNPAASPAISPNHLKYPVYLAIRYWVPSYIRFIRRIRTDPYLRKPIDIDKDYSKILQFIAENPGCTPRDIRRRFPSIKPEKRDGILRQLREEGKIAIRKEGRAEKLFPITVS